MLLLWLLTGTMKQLHAMVLMMDNSINLRRGRDFVLLMVRAISLLLNSYLGWDRIGQDATTAVAIHHPATDEKSISFEYQSTRIASFGVLGSPGDGTHVMVVDWDVGTTEPGSSGSPLFNQDHRLIGTLHGGGAACGNNEPDWYGGVLLHIFFQYRMCWIYPTIQHFSICLSGDGTLLRMPLLHQIHLK